MTHPPTSPRDYLPDTVDFDLAWRWIEALESGRYQQGCHVLRRGDTFCCLGVACDVANPSGWKETRVGFKWDREEAWLPRELRPMLALDQSGTPDKLRIHVDLWDLTRLNDTGSDFNEIAALLRDYYGFPPREDQL